ncbi:hypothetical protein Tco_0465053 [Tanacetum coccineum]
MTIHWNSGDEYQRGLSGNLLTFGNRAYCCLESGYAIEVYCLSYELKRPALARQIMETGYCFSERQKDKVAKNASKKRKWEGDHDGSSSQQQNKDHKMIRAHTTWLSNKKGYAKNLPLCTKCKFHHTGPCTENVAIASGLVIKLEIARTLQDMVSRWRNQIKWELEVERKTVGDYSVMANLLMFDVRPSRIT